MVKILDFKQFEEVELKFSDLAKGNRGDVLINKLRSGGTFSKMGGGEISFPQMLDTNLQNPVPSTQGVTNLINRGIYSHPKSGTYLATKGSERGTRYKNVLRSGEQNYSLKDLVKTREFGSKGAGARVQIFETIQIIFLSMQQDRIPFDEANAVERFKFYVGNRNHLGKIFTRVPISPNMIDQFINEPSWIYTFVEVPKRIFEENENYVDLTKRYKFYHESFIDENNVISPYKLIADKIKVFLRGATGSSGVNMAKFCPGDVYLIDNDSTIEVISELRRSGDINRLIDTMDELFSEGKFIPISLKMVKNNSKFKIITNNLLRNDRLYPVKFEFLGASTSKKIGIGIGSKIRVKTIYQRDRRDRVMLFQSSNTNERNNINGEVLGSTSRGHGKISFPKIKDIFDRYLNNEIYRPLYSPLDDYTTLNNLDNHDLIKKLKKSYQFANKILRDSPSLRDEYLGGYDILDLNNDIFIKNKIISKIQSLQVIRIILETKLADTRLCNKILTDMFKYALSIQIFDSQGNKINTPNYLRVI